jgi:hypothetical protein
LTGANQNGTCASKLSRHMIAPSTPIEYIAPFLRYANFETRSMPRIVTSRTTSAPMPLPTRISGTEVVNANAPTTPSIENEASSTSRYKSLLQALVADDFWSSSSAPSAFFRNPSVMKYAVAPIWADSPSAGSWWYANHDRTEMNSEADA